MKRSFNITQTVLLIVGASIISCVLKLIPTVGTVVMSLLPIFICCKIVGKKGLWGYLVISIEAIVDTVRQLIFDPNSTKLIAICGLVLYLTMVAVSFKYITSERSFPVKVMHSSLISLVGVVLVTSLCFVFKEDFVALYGKILETFKGLPQNVINQSVKSKLPQSFSEEDIQKYAVMGALAVSLPLYTLEAMLHVIIGTLAISIISPDNSKRTATWKSQKINLWLVFGGLLLVFMSIVTHKKLNDVLFFSLFVVGFNCFILGSVQNMLIGSSVLLYILKEVKAKQIDNLWYFLTLSFLGVFAFPLVFSLLFWVGVMDNMVDLRKKFLQRG